MTNNCVLRVLAVSIAVLEFNPVAAHAQMTDACASFTVSAGDERSVEYLDQGDEGPSPGDLRIGRRALVDESGNTVGYHRWVLINLDAPPGSGERSEYYGNHVLNLDDEGQIYYQVLAEVVGPPENTEQASTGDYTGVVVGGTGAYSFARGTVARSFDGVKGTFAVEIRCD
jgi:hypothetical protein